MKAPTYWAAASVVATVGVLHPTSIYLGSPREFPLLLSDYLLAALPLSALLIVGIGWLAARLPSGLDRRVAALMASIGLALWIQGSVIGWRLGPLDGRSFDWGHGWVAYLDWLVWAALIVGFQAVERLRRAAVIVACCWIPLFAQTVAAGYGVATLHEYRDLKRYDIDASQSMRFSAGRNLLFLILDEFQSDVFDELVRTEKGLSDAFVGFTYFRKALAPAGNTFPSVPAMITGQHYLNSAPVPEYLERAYRESSLFFRLRESGYRVELYPGPTDTVSLSPAQGDNIVVRTTRLEDRLRLFDAGLFRGAPFLLKRHVYRSGEWLTARLAGRLSEREVEEEPRLPDWYWADLEGFRAAIPAAGADRSERLFKFFHLSGMHVPLRYDEHLERVAPRYGRDSYLRQARGVLRLVTDLLLRLRQLGIYDDAMIVIAADHGSGGSADMLIAPGEPPAEGEAGHAFDVVKTRGAALLMAKPAGSSEPLRISDAQVSLIDIPATFGSWVEIDWEGRVGTDLFTVREQERRTRWHYSYRWEKPEQLYLHPISEYRVVGDSWDGASWRLSRILRRP